MTEQEGMYRQKVDYYFAKEHGICVRCKTRDAEPNRTMCLECAEKDRARKRKEAESWTEEQRKEVYAKKAESHRNMYYRRKEAGMCTRCGKRKASSHNLYCIDCNVKAKKYRIKKKGDAIPRSERKYYGLCYMCCEPVCEDSESLCQKHYNLYSGLMKNLNDNPTERMIEVRKNFKKLDRLIYKGSARG